MKVKYFEDTDTLYIELLDFNCQRKICLASVGFTVLAFTGTITTIYHLTLMLNIALMSIVTNCKRIGSWRNGVRI